MISDHLSPLEVSLNKAKLLLRGIPDHGCATDFQSVKLQSFVLLTHSAIEKFLEDLSEDAGIKSIQKFKRDGVISKTLVALISSGLIIEASKAKKKKAAAAMISDIATFADASYDTLKNTVIKNNHGIRKENIDALLFPIGVVGSTVGPSAYNSVDAFSDKSGQIAHKFGSIRTTLTKSAILTELHAIIIGLKEFDQAARHSLDVGMDTA